LTPIGTREAIAVPVQGSSEPSAPVAATSSDSIVAVDDHIEGKLKTARGLRILGTLDGSVESARDVHIEEGARVNADISAEEVVIAGHYSGKLTCRQRLEIRPTGRVSGTIETVKLMLHEGGFVDGELHMQKPSDPENGARPSSDALPESLRPVGAIRSTVEPSVRSSASSSSRSSARTEDASES
jgi:cytoskeletal protein CcmA (bactofilin family)